MHLRALLGLSAVADFPEDPLDARANPGLRAAVPGLARIAAGAALRTTEWTVGTYMKTTGRLVRAAANGESPTDFLQELGSEFRREARRVLGVEDIENRIRGVVGDRAAPAEGGTGDGTSQLRQAGSDLLSRSADVTYEEAAHPAYVRILGELAPDEGRILRLLATEGPQPAVDVRSGKTLSPASELVSSGHSMIGNEAGCRFTERVPAYLNNLFRLGLIWFSREPVKDLSRYQVLEAQPEVLKALHSGGRAKTVRRSINLTPFGVDFCRICLPLETAELPMEEPPPTGQAP